MPRPVMRTLLPFLRCLTIRPTKSSRVLVASFFVMPVFSASSAATLDSGTVGAVGFGALAIVEGSLAFFRFANVFLTPQAALTAQGYPRIAGPQALKARKMSISWAFSAIWGGHPQVRESVPRVPGRACPDFRHRREHLAVR